jgi:hypothetical protein
MNPQHRIRPSAGFILLVMSYTLLVSFLAWGYSRPDLERGWEILQALQRDDPPGLGRADAQTLETLLNKYPQFSRALIERNPLGFVEPTDEDWMSLPESHLVIQAAPGTALNVRVACRAERGAYPVRVSLEARGIRDQLEFSEDGEKNLNWSHRTSAQPLWLKVKVMPNAALAQVVARPKIRIRAAEPLTKEATP